MTKFNIGDTVYRARAEKTQALVKCPECVGSGRLRVILGDDTEVSIACSCCRSPDGSTGYLLSRIFHSGTQEMRITGIRSEMVNGSLHTQYKCQDGYLLNEEDLFTTEEEALSRASELARANEEQETQRLKNKEKNYRSWAWHVAYYRREIREAQERINYATQRLNEVPKNFKEIDKADKGATQ